MAENWSTKLTKMNSAQYQLRMFLLNIIERKQNRIVTV